MSNKRSGYIGLSKECDMNGIDYRRGFNEGWEEALDSLQKAARDVYYNDEDLWEVIEELCGLVKHRSVRNDIREIYDV